MTKQLVSRTRLAALLRVHPRTISRAIEAAGFGTPAYLPTGDAMFDPNIILKGLCMSRKFLKETMAGDDHAATPKEAAAILGLSVVDLYERTKRTGHPSPATAFAGGTLRSRTTKRFSRNEVLALAERDKLVRTLSILKAHAANERAA